MNFNVEVEIDNFVDINFDLIKAFLKKVENKEKKRIGEINFRIVSDDTILKINNEFLNHNYYTDIITFNSNFVNIINGDIIISFDTIKSNSNKFKTKIDSELYRVVIHGVMHLCGYNDSTNNEKIVMRNKENEYLKFIDKL